MFRVDVDNDGNVNRAEYINMLMEISPYKTYAEFGVIASDSCPDIGSIEDFLGDAPLSAVLRIRLSLSRTRRGRPRLL
jgi:hypothetical protein